MLRCVNFRIGICSNARGGWEGLHYYNVYVEFNLWNMYAVLKLLEQFKLVIGESRLLAGIHARNSHTAYAIMTGI